MSSFLRPSLLVALLATLLCVSAPGQQKNEAPAQKPKPAQPAPEKKISPAEAEELFQSVNQLLEFASQDTHLPIRKPVKKQLASRAEVGAFVRTRLQEDENAVRLRRSEVVLKKFGLLPRDFDLEKFLVDVLEEQVAGYYDPKTETVYLLDWVPAEAQRAFLAHEITHALQDQNFGLEKWLRVVDKASARPSAGAQQDLEPDEEMTARQAVTEGQATMVMIDFLLAASGKTPQDAPLLFEMFKRGTAEMTEASPVLGKAPLYLKESLLFTYTYGLEFVRFLMQEGGKQLAFDGALQHPPINTREVMEPQVYLDRHASDDEAVRRGPAPRFPNIAPALGDSYHTYDHGVLGQFDLHVLLKQFGGEKLADELTGKWRGGYYSVGWRKSSAAPPATVPGKGLTLFYLSEWPSAEDATRFAAEYSSWLIQRYRGVGKAAPDPKAKDFAGKIANQNKWVTEQGDVYVEPWGTSVLVMEGFDPATAARVREAVLGKGK